MSVPDLDVQVDITVRELEELKREYYLRGYRDAIRCDDPEYEDDEIGS